MHDLLFARVDDWAVEAPDAALVELAAELELDGEAFAACLQSRAALEPVLEDLLDAEGVAKVTPTFVFLYGGSGYVSEGTKSAEEFQALAFDLLQEAQAGNGQE
jgi:predicted DsbA family dithiol-disulfide isomerase